MARHIKLRAELIDTKVEKQAKITVLAMSHIDRNFGVTDPGNPYPEIFWKGKVRLCGVSISFPRIETFRENGMEYLNVVFTKVGDVIFTSPDYWADIKVAIEFYNYYFSDK